MNRLIVSINQIFFCLPALDRVSNNLNFIDHKKINQKIKKHKQFQKLSFHNVSFSYKNIKIFDNLNFEIVKKDFVTIPHSRCHKRNFVLYPIKQIDPNWIHPVLKQNINYLIKKLDFKSRIEITRLSKNVNIKL